MLTSSFERGPPSSVIVTYADSVSRKTSSDPEVTPGVDNGSVTCRNCRQRDAPSMRAASYRSSGIACSPARKMIML